MATSVTYTPVAVFVTVPGNFVLFINCYEVYNNKKVVFNSLPRQVFMFVQAIFWDTKSTTTQ
jgi:hypothetical protein